MNNILKILIADDHDLVREGLKIALGELPAGVTTLEAATAVEVIEACKAHPDIDLVILDLHMPGSNDLELLSGLCDVYPDLPVVVLSADESRSVMQRSIDRGAAGFIPKSAANSVLISALQLVMSGGIYIPPAMLEEQETDGTSTGGIRSAVRKITQPEFTDRQRDVLMLVAGGHSNKSIAKQLGLSEHTIKIHITAILRTLGVSNRTEAAIVCRERGLIGEE